MNFADNSALPLGPPDPSFVQAIRFGRDPIGYLEKCAQRYGDCFTLRLPGGRPTIVCSHPEDVRRIFALKPEGYCAAATALPVPLGLGSLVFLDGEAHLQDRKLMAPMLLGERLSEYGELMRQTTQEVCSRWPRHQSFALHPQMLSISLSIIAKCVFGIRDSQRRERICRLVADWLELALSPTLFMVGLLVSARTVREFFEHATARSGRRFAGRAPAWRRLPWQRLIDLKAELIAILLEELHRCRQAGPTDRQDILSLMAAARYEDGSAPTDDRIVDQLVSMLVGGHETAANALCWTLSYILPRPEVMARIRAELAATVSDRAGTETSIPRQPYLDACIQESMRLLPVAVAISRVLTAPLELVKTVVPAGSNAWACPHLTHRRPELWPEPAAFRPERFLAEAAPSDNPGLGCPRESYYPFGGGRRRCVGMTFANYELRVVLAQLLASTSLALAPDCAPTPVLRGISFTPSDGLRVVMS